MRHLLSLVLEMDLQNSNTPWTSVAVVVSLSTTWAVSKLWPGAMNGNGRSCPCRGACCAGTAALSSVLSVQSLCRAHHRALSPLAMRADKLLTSPQHSYKAALTVSQGSSSPATGHKPGYESTAMVGRGNLKAESCPSTWNVFRFQCLTPLFLHKMP